MLCGGNIEFIIGDFANFILEFIFPYLQNPHWYIRDDKYNQSNYFKINIIHDPTAEK
jgi:hypothetical protein